MVFEPAMFTFYIKVCVSCFHRFLPMRIHWSYWMTVTVPQDSCDLMELANGFSGKPNNVQGPGECFAIEMNLLNIYNWYDVCRWAVHTELRIIRKANGCLDINVYGTSMCSCIAILGNVFSIENQKQNKQQILHLPTSNKHLIVCMHKYTVCIWLYWTQAFLNWFSLPLF